MSKSMRSLCWALLLALFVTGFMAQAAMAFDVSGTVDDGTNPVSGATVTLIDPVGPTVVGATSTDGAGAYTIPGVVNGTYDLTVTAATFQDALVSGIVVLDANLTQDVTLASLPTADHPDQVIYPSAATWSRPGETAYVMWTPSHTPGASYELQANQDGAGFATVYSGPLTGLNFPTAAGSSYTFRVRASATGYLPSTWTTAPNTLVVTGACAIPKAFNVTSWSSASSLPLYWSASTTPGVTYEVQMAVDGGAFGANIYSGTTANYTVTGLESGKNYVFRVRATLAGFAPSGWRVSGSCAVSLQAAMPGTFTVNSWASTDSLMLSWKPSATAGVTYELQQSTDGGSNWADVLPGPGLATSMTVSGLTTGLTYTFQVRATLAGYAPSAWRLSSNAVVVALQCSPPSNFKVPSNLKDGDFTIYWKMSRTAGATYELQVDEGSGWGPSIPVAATSYDYSAPAPGTYKFQVRAVAAGYAPSAWIVSNPLELSATASYAGIKNCVYCHRKYGQPWEWIASGHGNQNNRPSNSYYGNAATACAPCHDPQGDGAAMTSVDGTSRPVVGCEGCHGPSNLHRGGTSTNGGKLPPNPVPLADVCVTCHNNPDGHPGQIGDQVLASRHNEGLHGSTTAKCQRCHSYEGSVAFAAYTGDQTVMNQMDTANGGAPVTALTTVTNLTCNACHDPHFTDMRVPAGWDPNGNGKDQFDQCTSCHTYQNPDGTLVASGTVASGTAPFYHNTRWTRMIATTHYDNPATGPASGDAEAPIEGYVLRINGANPCFDCHGHELTTNTEDAPGVTTIHTQYAMSAHAGHLLQQKQAAADTQVDGTVEEVDAVMTAAADDTTGIGWTHYNWDRSGRASCQRCHTSTGVSNFLDDPVGYDQGANDFSHLSGWSANPAAGSPQNEMLYCWGCHSNAGEGVLRDPGALTFTYTNGATATYPDVSSSNVCIACHSGRETGDSIKLDPDADGIRNFINSHYLTAGGTVFATTGYEYDGQDYNFGYHQNVGVGDVLASGTSGPCAACHMSGPQPHTWDFLTKDAGGVILTNDSTLCANCHDGIMTGPALETRKLDFETALDELATALEAHGIYFNPASYPYFFQADLSTSYTDWAAPYGFSEWKNVMGAAFNLNLLDHDPGSYAHNRDYALKLIVDSIDFIDDGVINNSAAGSAAAALLAIDTSPHVDALASVVNDPVVDEVICSQCHVSPPHYGGAVLVQAQYAVTTTAHATDCADCHAGGTVVNDALINAQYAQSGHGDVAGDPWYHYDWRLDSRATCQRCHTATGFLAKLNNEADITPVFDGVADTGADINLPNETLRCNACHTDIGTGAMQAAGAFTASYTNGATVSYPDVGKSNLCLRCHTGRETGDSIKLDADPDGIRNFINSHYLTAGGTLFRETGYEYDANGNTLADDYPEGPGFLHDEIGFVDPLIPTASDAGPCAGCHMGTATYDHTWNVVTKDGSDTITAINSNTCASCHGGLTPAALQAEKDAFHAALAALEAALQANGIYFKPAYPYFFLADLTTSFTDWASVYGLANWKDVMGAAFNYNLLEHDPGAFAHNSYYAKLLIFDAINFLDDGDATSASIDLTAYPAAAAYLNGADPVGAVTRP